MLCLGDMQGLIGLIDELPIVDSLPVSAADMGALMEYTHHTKLKQDKNFILLE